MNIRALILGVSLSVLASAAVAQTGQPISAYPFSPKPYTGLECAIGSQAPATPNTVQICTAPIATLALSPSNITGENAASPLTGSELVPGVQSLGAVKMTTGGIKTYILTAPNIGVATGSSLAVAGCSLGALYTLCVNGQQELGSSLTIDNGIIAITTSGAYISLAENGHVIYLQSGPNTTDDLSANVTLTLPNIGGQSGVAASGWLLGIQSGALGSGHIPAATTPDGGWMVDSGLIAPGGGILYGTVLEASTGIGINATPTASVPFNEAVPTGDTALNITTGSSAAWAIGGNAGAGPGDNDWAFYYPTWGAAHGFAPILWLEASTGITHVSGSIVIPAGTINGTTIGGTTPAALTCSTCTAVIYSQSPYYYVNIDAGFVDFGVANDVGISRGGGAGILAIGSGAAGDYTGTVKATHFTSGTSAGVSCSAGTVNLTTEVVTNGIVTHC